MRRYSTLLLPLLMVLACQSAPDPMPRDVRQSPGEVTAAVTIATDSSSYRAGAEVGLNIRNRLSQSLGFNPCTRTIERHRGGNMWEALRDSERICTMELWLLEPRQIRSATTDLPDDLAPGTYRLTISFSPQASGQTQPIVASTQPFTVR